MAKARYTAAPANWTLTPEHLRKLAQVLQQAQDGRTNNAYEMTLTPDATSTSIINPRCNTGSVVTLSPQTASAATALPFVWVEPGKGKVTFNHDSNAAKDRTFGYTITA
jgi:hypothetical protein